MSICSAIAEFFGGVGKFLSYRYDPKQVAKREQTEVDKRVHAAQDAAHNGNEDKVNEIINRTCKIAVVVLLVGAVAGCATRVVYVDDSARTVRMELNGKPGWWVPAATMAAMLAKLEQTQK